MCALLHTSHFFLSHIFTPPILIRNIFNLFSLYDYRMKLKLCKIHQHYIAIIDDRHSDGITLVPSIDASVTGIWFATSQICLYWFMVVHCSEQFRTSRYHNVIISYVSHKYIIQYTFKNINTQSHSYSYTQRWWASARAQCSLNNIAIFMLLWIMF